jgi:hypothetical protein
MLDPQRLFRGQVFERAVRQDNTDKLGGPLRDIHAKLEALSSQAALYVEANFNERAEALEFIEADLIDRIDGLLPRYGRSQALTDLKLSAERLKTRLEALDEILFSKLRHKIASGRYTNIELRQMIGAYAVSDEKQAFAGYDNLDTLVNGLLLSEAAPEDPGQREPEMFFYQPTPARVILELVDRANFGPADVFYDIGSGLGQVAIMSNLLCGVQARGVEIEQAYCGYAKNCANGLKLSGVRFCNQDARDTDYSDGTVFFMYTPCEGRTLDQVLERLRDTSGQDRIRLYTYGPCTPQVARQSWLERLDQNNKQVNRLASFKTLHPGPAN